MTGSSDPKELVMKEYFIKPKCAVDKPPEIWNRVRFPDGDYKVVALKYDIVLIKGNPVEIEKEKV